MGGLFGSSPPPPPPPPPPAPVVTPTQDDPAVEEARRKELQAATLARGRAATLLTGGQGATQAPLAKTTLLGG